MSNIRPLPDRTHLRIVPEPKQQTSPSPMVVVWGLLIVFLAFTFGAMIGFFAGALGGNNFTVALVSCAFGALTTGCVISYAIGLLRP